MVHPPTPSQPPDTTGPARRGMSREEFRVIAASSVGTAFEWYDFFLYGSLIPVIGSKFFGGYPPAAQTVFALLTFGIGFVVRPLGALVWARFGDLVGRKAIFMITLIIMGLSTLAVGLLPTSAEIGWAAPVLLLTCRVLQGLAISGEFGGAVTYVAEHAPPARRGAFVGWLPATVALSIFLSLGVLLSVQFITGPEAFDAWGWRLPFLISVVPLAISVWIRLKLRESPLFLRMKAEGAQSRAPIRESFTRRRNLRVVLIALAMVAAQSFVGYVSTFYTLTLLTSTLKVDTLTANTLFLGLMLCAFLLCGFFSWLSDKVGRKPVMLAGFALAVATYFPIFHGVAALANPALAEAQDRVRIQLVADPADCSFQFNPAGTASFTSDCDRAKQLLARWSAAYENVAGRPDAPVTVVVDGRTLTAGPGLEAELGDALTRAGYPAEGSGTVRIDGPGDLLDGRVVLLFLLLLALVSYAQMTQGPAASAMVELFPTRIRYTAMSLPFQVGTGWFGGVAPAVMVAINAEAGNIFAGLWYPTIMIVIGAVICLLALPETRGIDLDAVDTAARPARRLARRRGTAVG
ncbi:MFS family permease [Thermocatellispora tengchongensis]|uniref:MFS family permease n=1 Tax=Thermocatellispora tengchongensis TaxID=1073253 RepID=A0A840NXN6_9ACTN|nr:MFS transporter [Thermocatellispora tengchongensis]MBB5133624.1 MFS family permease [Thermocatellispora tengchongensis]